jgi:ABC-type uncharacterized transport system substrate-binding protein
MVPIHAAPPRRSNRMSTHHFLRHLFRLGLALLASALVAPSASAHPHVWVTMKTELVYAPDGAVTAVRHVWTFDDMYSVFATQGIKGKVKGEFTREELKPLAELNVTSLKDFGFFTFAKANGKKTPLAEPIDYYLDWDSKSTVLTLHFTLPFKAPVQAKELSVDIFDPEFFVDFSFAEKDPVALVDAPTRCKLDVQRPKELTAADAVQLGEDFFSKLSSSSSWAAQFANKIAVTCP